MWNLKPIEEERGFAWPINMTTFSKRVDLCHNWSVDWEKDLNMKKKRKKKSPPCSHIYWSTLSVTVGGIAQKKFITWGYLKCLKCATATPNPFAHTFTFPNHRGIDAVWFAHHNSSRLVFARWFCADALYNSWPQWPCEHRQVWLQTTWLRHNIWSMT